LEGWKDEEEDVSSCRMKEMWKGEKTRKRHKQLLDGLKEKER